MIWSPFEAEASYEIVSRHLREHDDVGGMFVNSILPMEGLIRFFPEASELCRHIHYGVFDYHPYMRLLTDLKIFSVKQDLRRGSCGRPSRCSAPGRRSIPASPFPCPTS